MFIAIQLHAPESAFWQRLYRRFFPREVEIEKVNIMDNAYFLKMQVYPDAHGIPWNEIRLIAGRESQRIVFPEGVNPPKGSGLSLYRPMIFPQSVMLATLQSLLKKSGVDSKSLAITVLDPKGEFPRAIKALIRYASVIRVVTQNLPVYEKISQWAEEEYDASVVVTSELDPDCAAPIIFAPYGVSGEDVLPAQAIVFAYGEPAALNQENMLVPTWLSLPEKIIQVLPPGFDPMLFASAAYERCGLLSLGRLRYASFQWGGAEIGFYDVVRMIKTRIRAPAT